MPTDYRQQFASTNAKRRHALRAAIALLVASRLITPVHAEGNPGEARPLPSTSVGSSVPVLKSMGVRFLEPSKSESNTNAAPPSGTTYTMPNMVLSPPGVSTQQSGKSAAASNPASPGKVLIRISDVKESHAAITPAANNSSSLPLPDPSVITHTNAATSLPTINSVQASGAPSQLVLNTTSSVEPAASPVRAPEVVRMPPMRVVAVQAAVQEHNESLGTRKSNEVAETNTDQLALPPAVHETAAADLQLLESESPVSNIQETATHALSSQNQTTVSLTNPPAFAAIDSVSPTQIYTQQSVSAQSNNVPGSMPIVESAASDVSSVASVQPIPVPITVLSADPVRLSDSGRHQVTENLPATNPVATSATGSAPKYVQPSIVVESQESRSANRNSLTVTPREVITQKFGQAIVTITVHDESICKAFLVEKQSVAVMGLTEGSTAIELTYASGETQVITVRTEPNARVDDNAHQEKMGQVLSTISDLYPQSTILIRTSPTGGLIVAGNASNEKEAKEIVSLVRKMFLIPVEDRVLVGRR